MPEVQSVALLGASAEPVYLAFLEQNITVTIGTDTPADIQASLEALFTVRAQHPKFRRSFRFQVLFVTVHSPSSTPSRKYVYGH